MSGSESAMVSQAIPKKGKKYFTLAEARKALPLVRRIAADVQQAQAQRVRLHAQATSESESLSQAQLNGLQKDFDQQTVLLEKCVHELEQIGVDLKDASTGLLDFPSIYEGREIELCWKAGEETIAHWHEADTGYAGRRPVLELHDQPE